MPHEVVGTVLLQRADFQRIKGVLNMHRFCGHLGPLGIPGGIGVGQVVDLCGLKNLNQHGAALGNLRLGIAGRHNAVQKTVDMDGQDLVHRGVLKVVLQMPQRVLVIAVSGGLHLTAIIRVPCVGPLREGHLLADGNAALRFTVEVLLQLDTCLCLCRRRKGDHVLLAVIPVAVHTGDGPIAAGQMTEAALAVAVLCHVVPPPLQTRRDAGALLYPVEEGGAGDADTSAETGYGEVLSMGQRVGGGLADVQIGLHIGNSHKSGFVHNSNSFRFRKRENAGVYRTAL